MTSTTLHLLGVVTAVGLLVLTATYRAAHVGRHSNSMSGTLADELPPACCGHLEWWLDTTEKSWAPARERNQPYAWSAGLVVQAVGWHVHEQTGFLFAVLLTQFGVILFGIRLRE